MPGPGKEEGAHPPNALKRAKRPLAVFAAAAVLLAVSAALMVPMTFPDVSYQRVSFINAYSADAEKIAGLLVLPDEPARQPVPALVFAHGLTGCKEFYLSLYRGLAVKGIAVLAVDLPGHGDSGGHTDLGLSEHTALLAAYDWLVENRPEIDPEKVAVAGHSLGGITATRAGVFQPERKFCAVAAVFCWQGDRAALEELFGPIERYVGRIWPHLIFSRDYDINDPSTAEQRDLMPLLGPSVPPNFQLTIGAMDEFCSVRHERELMARALGLEREEELEEGRIYGSFEEGTARQLVVTGDSHISEAFSMEVFGAMYNWLCRAFGLERRGTTPVPALRFSLWALILGCSILMAGSFAVALSLLLEERMRFPSSAGLAPLPAEGPRRRLMPWCSLSYLCLTAVLAWPLAVWLGLSALAPFLLGDLVSSLVLLRGALTVAGIAAGLMLFYNVSLFSRGLIRAEAAGPTLWAAVPPLGGIAMLMLLYAPLSRLLLLGRGLPFNWGWFLAYSALVALFFWAEGRYCHLFLLPLFGDVRERGHRLGYLACEAGVRSAAQTLAFLPLVITSPWHVIGRAGHIRLPVLLVALLIAYPLFLCLAWLNLLSRERRFSLLLPSLGVALLQAWCLTALLCAR